MAKKRRIDTDFWDHIEHQDRLYRQYRKKFGLDGQIEHGPLLYDFSEIERQTRVLLERERGPVWEGKMPEDFVNYCAVRFLSCYVTAGERVPSVVLLLVAEQLKVSEFGYRWAKKPTAFLKAERFVQEHPETTQAEVAREVGVTRGTVSKWVKAGKLVIRESGRRK